MNVKDNCLVSVKRGVSIMNKNTNAFSAYPNNGFDAQQQFNQIPNSFSTSIFIVLILYVGFIFTCNVVYANNNPATPTSVSDESATALDKELSLLEHHYRLGGLDQVVYWLKRGKWSDVKYSQIIKRLDEIAFTKLSKKEKFRIWRGKHKTLTSFGPFILWILSLLFLGPLICGIITGFAWIYYRYYGCLAPLYDDLFTQLVFGSVFVISGIFGIIYTTYVISLWIPILNKISTSLTGLACIISIIAGIISIIVFFRSRS
jgi:hypothetical protein